MDRARSSSPSQGAPQEVETRAELARELTGLRVRSGLTIRELARRLDVPSATIGGYFSGRHLPSPAQLDLFRDLLRGCGVPEESLQLWVDALTRVRVSTDGRVSRMPAPYRGLEAFQMEDAGLFFGRETAIAEILDRLKRLGGAASSSPRLLIVLGPSGSGKSSLLRAGVAAQVRDGALEGIAGDRSVAVITPGEAPAEVLRERLAGTEPPRLIVVDQLEEVFAVEERERTRFLAELAEIDAQDTFVVAGLRTDFFEAALKEPVLLGALRSGAQVLLGPMTAEEVARAITEPARIAGVPVEEGLVDLLLADLAPGGGNGHAHEAGALPLLSHALLATWEHARRNQLSVADYREVGGLRGAVSQTAEAMYAQLDPAEQELARRIFCRLVRAPDDGPLTRRRVARAELEELAASQPSAGAAAGHGATPTNTAGDAAANNHGGASASVLERFVRARLLTVDGGTVELSHEALLTAWPRLATWLEDDREWLRHHHQVTDAANAWAASGEDPSALLRGARLQTVLEWIAKPGRLGELNRMERAFVDAGAALAERERLEARRRTRRMQQLLGLVAVVAAAAVAFAVVAINARQSANRARDEALSRQVAIESAQLEPSDPALAMQLAVAAYRISHTTQATSTLLDASASEMPTRLLGPTGPTSAALSPSGPELAVAHSATNVVSLYSLADGRPTPLGSASTGPASSQLFAVALSPNGRLLAAGGTSRQVVLWSLATPAHPVRLATLGGFRDTVNAISFSPDGRLLAAADSDGTVRQWSLATTSDPAPQAVLTAPGRAGLQAVAYSPDGRTLAAAGSGGTLVIWRVVGGAVLATRTVTASAITSVAYSPDGLTLAAGAQDGHVYLWRTGDRGTLQVEHRPLGGFTSWVDSLAFSPGGSYLAAGDSDSTLRIWSTATWAHVATLVHTAPVTGIMFTPDARRLVTVDEDGTTRIWSFPPPAVVREPGSVYTVDYNGTGSELAAVSGGPAGNVDLWNVADPWRPVHVSAVAMPRSFGPAAGVEAFSPDGKLLAVGNLHAKVALLDLSHPLHPRQIGRLLAGATPLIEQLNFSPDMKLMSTGDDSGRIHLWDIADPADPVALGSFNVDGHCGQVFGVAYSASGKLLAAACADHEVGLWDISSPSHPRRLAVLGGFASYAYTVTFTPNGRTLIAGSADDTIRLWDVSDPAHPRPIGHLLTGPNSTVYNIAVSPDGSTLAAATTNQDVWLWNISRPAHPVQVADLRAATGQIFDVTFSPNGRTLVASGGDQILHFWDYRPGQVAARICARAGTPITRAEWSSYIPGAPYRPPCR